MRERWSLNGMWQLGWSDGPDQVPGEWLPARVPGDIHADLSRAGRLPEDLFRGTNLRQAAWVDEKTWWYRTAFQWSGERTAGADESTELDLVFEGLDLFAAVHLNGTELGRTDNMFRTFRFDVRSRLREGDNDLTVMILPTRPEVTRLHERFPDYRAIFTPGRSLVRKAQCQFGWDWAPDAPSLGIWRDVYLDMRDARTIRDLFFETRVDGQVCVRVELGGDLRDGCLDVEIDDGENVVRGAVPTQGHNHFVNLTIPAPRLWWPNGWGEPFLYSCRVYLRRGADVLDSCTRSFGIREVVIEEESVAVDRMGFRLRVNGQPIFCKGANWVPSDCFPGTVPEMRYAYLIQRARDAHFNMLRIWGGGIYEHDCFYELCDRFGIMVWQDFMNACAEPPDDQSWFLDNVMTEAVEQVKRLRHHPSIMVWCGGNESSSSHRYQPDRPGRRLAHHYLRGVVGDLSPATPYIYSSPHSKSDFGQIQTSGETHWSSWPRQPEVRYDTFRQRQREVRTVFNGEICLQGPSPLASVLRWADQADIWPPNEVMDFHVMRHPANPRTHPRFAISQLKMAEQLIGPCTDARTYINNAMMAHAEMVRADLEFYRLQKFRNSGALLWMYNECWPCSNWATVDYYGYLKPAYFAARRAFAPLSVALAQLREEEISVVLMNDTLRPADGDLVLIGMDVDGTVYWRQEQSAGCPANESVEAAAVPVARLAPATSFLRAVWRCDDCIIARNVFSRLWRQVPFPTPTLDWDVSAGRRTDGGEWLTPVTVRTDVYARFVHVTVPDSARRDVSWSDNYVDLVAGEEREIVLTSPGPLEGVGVETLQGTSARQ